MSSPCAVKITKETESTAAEADELINRLTNMAKERVRNTGVDMSTALNQLKLEVQTQQSLFNKVQARNQLLNIQAKERIKSHAMRFDTYGEGLVAYMEGSSKKVNGARLSVDYQGKAIHGKYFGRLVSDLEEAGVLSEFRRGELAKEIYQEMGELGKVNGKPGISGSQKAMKIARIVENVTSEMVARQNRAGAFIMKMPGYVTRQTHDRTQIRLVGGGGPEGKEKSFKIWSEFITPLLDHEKTFQGKDPMKFLRNVHEELYTGTFGGVTDAGEVMGIVPLGADIGKKASASRVLHFADAESAFKYNQEFGIRHIRDAVFSDVWYRSRNIALMEAFGPNPEMVLQRTVRELKELAREDPLGSGKSVEHTESLNDWKIKAAFDTVMGKNDIPANFTLHRTVQFAKSIAQMAKMGSTLLSSFADKATLQSEMSFQGISAMQTFTKQFVGMLKRSPEQEKMIRMMGVAMDGLVGNTQSRYTLHTTLSGFAHRANQRFFDVNFMNWWTDVHKATAAELMSHHLGDHSHLELNQLPPDLQKVLKLYDISPTEWNLIRSTAWENKTGEKFITPDKLNNIPNDTIDALIHERGIKVNDSNRLKVMDSLETKLRSYITDRVDIAIPTPGAAEKRMLTLGTQAGTPLGEAIRVLTMFKSFPLTILNKLVARDVYGQGANTIGQWLMNDHRGKFNLASLVAMTTAAGYMSGAVRDALKGREPKPLIDENGKFVYNTLNDAMLRGGGLGIMGDMLFSEYDRHYRGFTSSLAGPIAGQFDTLADVFTKVKTGNLKDLPSEAGKLTLDNTPYINLFYIRPVLDYFVFWNLQEMMDPGSLERMEKSVMQKNHQTFFVKPSDVAK